jgi:hypothetical protein
VELVDEVPTAGAVAVMSDAAFADYARAVDAVTTAASSSSS